MSPRGGARAQVVAEHSGRGLVTSVRVLTQPGAVGGPDAMRSVEVRVRGRMVGSLQVPTDLVPELVAILLSAGSAR